MNNMHKMQLMPLFCQWVSHQQFLLQLFWSFPHCGIFSELSESLGQEGDTPGYIISLKKCQVTLNSIYHYKVHASHWNPNTVSEGEAKGRREKKGKSSPSTLTIANLNMTAEIFVLLIWIQLKPCLCSIFSANPQSIN